VVYYHVGDTTITGSWEVENGAKVMVFVRGDVVFEKNVTVTKPNGFLAVIASGNITFGKEVTQAQGLFVADKAIIIQGDTNPDGNQQFLGEGSFVGWGQGGTKGIILNRSLGDQSNRLIPSVKFISRPEFWVNFPGDFTYTTSYREERLP
jgi:hypothetical protein